MSTAQPTEENDWLIDLILSFFHSMEWKAPVLSFIETKCVCFDSEDENKLEYTTIHKEFKNLTEGLIEGMLKELGANNDQFADAFAKANETVGFQKVAKVIQSIDDFGVFKKMMVKKNENLNKEAIMMLQAQEES